MKNFRLIIATCSATIALSSCEKSINVDVPPVEKRLAIFSVGEVGSPTNMLVKATAAIKEQKNRPSLDVTDATAILYTDGVPVDTMTYASTFGYVSKIQFVAGKNYTVKVTAPNYPAIEATCTPPQPVPIEGVVRTYNARKNMDGDYEDALVLTFNDPPEPGDCYMVRIVPPQDTGLFYFGSCVYTADASVETPGGDIADAETCLDNGGIFLRDALFNGRRKELKLYINPATLGPAIVGTDTTYGSIELIHVPEAYYKYRQSRKVAQDADSNPFAEPANVYTNVKEGYGIFSVVSTAWQLIR